MQAIAYRIGVCRAGQDATQNGAYTIAGPGALQYRSRAGREFGRSKKGAEKNPAGGHAKQDDEPNQEQELTSADRGPDGIRFCDVGLKATNRQGNALKDLVLRVGFA
jgi:hypothetical protein